MKDIFTSFDDENEESGESFGRISFDDREPENKNDVFTVNINGFEDFDTGRENDRIFSDERFSDSGFSDRSPQAVQNEPNFELYRKKTDINAPYMPDATEYELPHESTDDEFIKAKPSKAIKKKGNKSIKKTVVTAVICIIVIAIAGAFAYAYSLCGKVNSQPDTHKENAYISENKLYSDSNVYNILVIGTDKRETQANYRSDSMILVSLDKNTKKIKLTSFLRDSYVYIPAKDYSTKLNASCAYGGPQMVIDTIEYNFKVHIDSYVMIDFDIFKTIIHDLGGVTLTMTEEEAACIRRESGYKCKAGTHTYKAKIALWYARIRHIDSDFKRTERQRKVIQAVIDKMKKTDPITLAKMFDEVLPMVETDLTSSELFSLAFKALPLLSGDIEEMYVPAAKTWSNATINGQAVLKLDLEENTKLLKKFIYGK